ncbi:DUF839 domain-containing protein [Methylotenera sp. L2L1]|uniref:DUF839 domain-containing protein n=1 Tax=Methylotenera sp. L2L1 TaxID=1502770 RepID=UPI00055F2754|nr:DUF839 domain-containing protein [Methylotenera sp. L2L1]
MLKINLIAFVINLSFLFNVNITLAAQGPTSSQTPYITPTALGWEVTSIMTVGDQATNGFKMVGIPDGLGAYDNGDDTFTLLMNHELGPGLGAVRSHGATGAFVSEFKINKNTLALVSGNDLAVNHQIWSGTGYQAATGTAKSFARLCSGDLPAVSAFYNASTGLGTQSRIMMNGEENGSEGRAYAFIASGANKGTAYELPRMGNFSFENNLANPYSGDQTIVIGTNDSTPGHVYIYKGTKTNTGNEIDKAGLTNGHLYGVKVNAVITESEAINGTFTLEPVNYDQTGAALQVESNTKDITSFARPEDGHWADVDTFYFATTGTAAGGSAKLYKLDFNKNMSGGTISMVKDSATLLGTDGETARNFDNMTVDTEGNIMIQEDSGNNAYISKIWKFDLVANTWTQAFESDRSRFIPGAPKFLTQDEENSGIIDVTEVIGRRDGKKYYIGVTQAHYAIKGELVEGGQVYLLTGPTPKLNK